LYIESHESFDEFNIGRIHTFDCSSDGFVGIGKARSHSIRHAEQTRKLNRYCRIRVSFALPIYIRTPCISLARAWQQDSSLCFVQSSNSLDVFPATEPLIVSSGASISLRVQIDETSKCFHLMLFPGGFGIVWMTRLSITISIHNRSGNSFRLVTQKTIIPLFV
jgi:hypothetical protein